MRRRLRWWFAVALAAMAVVLAPPVRAEDRVVSTSLESWYARVPSVEPRPPDTLHVGVLLGVEESRTYLALDLSGVEATVRGGTLRLPVDLASSRSPEVAALDVCLAGSPGPPVEGGTGEPPGVDCTVAAPASYDAAATTLVADLAPFADALRTSGLALVPRTGAATATWHVALWGRENASPDARPISATLRLPDRAAPTTPAVDVDVVPTPEPRPAPAFSAEGTALAAVVPFTAEAIVPPAPAPVLQLGAADPGTVAVAQAPVTPVAPARSVGVGGVGVVPPGSWAFTVPLVLLGLGCYLGSLLTRPALAPGRGAPGGAPPPGGGARSPSTDG